MSAAVRSTVAAALSLSWRGCGCDGSTMVMSPQLNVRTAVVPFAETNSTWAVPTLSSSEVMVPMLRLSQ
ncbi:MAG: hypothetical protein ABMA25_26325, partial [Ilumatobacteraceae bacterium]